MEILALKDRGNKDSSTKDQAAARHQRPKVDRLPDTEQRGPLETAQALVVASLHRRLQQALELDETHRRQTVPGTAQPTDPGPKGMFTRMTLQQLELEMKLLAELHQAFEHRHPPAMEEHYIRNFTADVIKQLQVDETVLEQWSEVFENNLKALKAARRTCAAIRKEDRLAPEGQNAQMKQDRQVRLGSAESKLKDALIMVERDKAHRASLELQIEQATKDRRLLKVKEPDDVYEVLMVTAKKKTTGRQRERWLEITQAMIDCPNIARDRHLLKEAALAARQRGLKARSALCADPAPLEAWNKHVQAIQRQLTAATRTLKEFRSMKL